MSCGRLSNKCSEGDFRTGVLNKCSSQAGRTSVRFSDFGGSQLWGWRVKNRGGKSRDQDLNFANLAHPGRWVKTFFVYVFDKCIKGGAKLESANTGTPKKEEKNDQNTN